MPVCAVRVRLAFALAVSAALSSATAHIIRASSPPPLELATLIAREATAGVLVGTMARLIMSTLDTAGYLIAAQTGLAFATPSIPARARKGPWFPRFFR